MSSVREDGRLNFLRSHGLQWDVDEFDVEGEGLDEDLPVIHRSSVCWSWMAMRLESAILDEPGQSLFQVTVAMVQSPFMTGGMMLVMTPVTNQMGSVGEVAQDLRKCLAYLTVSPVVGSLLIVVGVFEGLDADGASVVGDGD